MKKIAQVLLMGICVFLHIDGSVHQQNEDIKFVADAVWYGVLSL
jgi:hypothetical protein